VVKHNHSVAGKRRAANDAGMKTTAVFENCQSFQRVAIRIAAAVAPGSLAQAADPASSRSVTGKENKEADNSIEIRGTLNR
jgi:hypothetical protein